MHSDLWDYWPTRAGVDPTGFEVEALDARLGVVESAVWHTGASYLVVSTPLAFRGRVLVPAGLVEQVDVDSATISLDREREEILRSPGFQGVLDATYRAQLSGYYGLRAAQRERLAARGPGR